MKQARGEFLASRLANFCCTLEFADLPEPVVRKTKQCILDILGIFAAGSQVPVSRIVAEYVRQVGSRLESVVIGHGFRTDVCNAAFANGTFGHSIEMDEQHNPSITHPSPALVAAALAVGERERVNGSDFIAAIVAGYEVMTRIGMAVAPSVLVDRGFHPTAVTGTLGTAAVAGRLLKLTDNQMAHALSVSAMHSSGLFEYLFSGGEFKRVHPGMAAHGGIRSALLAKLGMTGPLSVLEGEKGFLNAFSNAPNPGPILDGLGSEFQVLKVAFKPYSSCRLTHSSIDAATILKQKYEIKPDLVDMVTVSTCNAMAKLNNQEPTDTFSGQFSIPFSVALALVNGSNLLKDYSPENIRRKDLLALAEKVQVVTDTSMDALYPGIIGARATIRMRDGKEVTEYVKFPTGEPENPMSKERLGDKFRSLISTVLPSENVRRIEDAVDHLEKIKSISELADLLSRPEAR